MINNFIDWMNGEVMLPEGIGGHTHTLNREYCDTDDNCAAKETSHCFKGCPRCKSNYIRKEVGYRKEQEEKRKLEEVIATIVGDMK